MAKDVATPQKKVVPNSPTPPKPKEKYYKVPEDVMVGMRRFLGSCPFDSVVQLIASLQRAELKEE